MGSGSEVGSTGRNEVVAGIVVGDDTEGAGCGCGGYGCGCVGREV